MPENKKWDIQVNGLGEKLKWYMLYASDEEYDEKAVESIMYLLDKWEPLEEGAVPPVEESWKRFLAVADRKELLPTEDAAVKAGAEGPNAGQTQKPVPEEDGAEHCMAVQKLKSGAGGRARKGEGKHVPYRVRDRKPRRICRQVESRIIFCGQ